MTSIQKRIAFLFPGQGSQSIGMCDELASQFSIIKDIFVRSSDILGYDLWKIVHEGPEEKLNQTIYTQPAIFVASYTLYQILKERFNIHPHFFAGHSLGEYSALACSESIVFEDTLKLIAKRAEFMQTAVPEQIGGMAAIVGLTDEHVDQICQQSSEKDAIVTAANFNAPGQVVISGHINAVKIALEKAKREGAKLTKLLPLSVPSHCPLMKTASIKFEKYLLDSFFKLPKACVVSNVTAEKYLSTTEIKKNLVSQLYMPVQWVKTILYMREAGVTLLVECGPGKVLTGLNKRIDASMHCINGADFNQMDDYLRRISQDGR